jgi:hypothetical protein
MSSSAATFRRRQKGQYGFAAGKEVLTDCRGACSREQGSAGNGVGMVSAQPKKNPRNAVARETL